MPTIEFTLGDTTASVEIWPDHGDPNVVFSEGPGRIADAVADHGYRFADRTGIAYQELSRAYREATDPDHITLGDLSERVVPVDVPKDDPDSDPDHGDGIILTLIGPEEERLERTFGAQQNLGAVAAAVTEAYDLEVTDQVVLAPTAAREDPFSTETGVGDLTEQTVYWATETAEA